MSIRGKPTNVRKQSPNTPKNYHLITQENALSFRSNNQLTACDHREGLSFYIFGCVVLFLVIWNSAHVCIMAQHLHMNDFWKFYYASVAFLNNESMYDLSLATLTHIGQENWQEFWNLPPPHFHILLLPLALMPESWSLLLWTTINFLALLMTLKWIKQELTLELSLN